MAAGLIVPISGPYVGTYTPVGGSAFPLGVQNDDGFELQCTIQGQEINESDQYGMTLMEGIYRGQNWRLRLRGLEWNKRGLLALLQMFGFLVDSTTLDPILNIQQMGNRWTAVAGTLILTAILGNPPTTPQTLTALSAAIAPQSQASFNFTSKMREMPLELILIPYTTATSPAVIIVPFTTT